MLKLFITLDFWLIMVVILPSASWRNTSLVDYKTHQPLRYTLVILFWLIELSTFYLPGRPCTTKVCLSIYLSLMSFYLRRVLNLLQSYLNFKYWD